MTRPSSPAASISGARLLSGFAAGFAATLVFHQIGLEICHLIGLTSGTPYDWTTKVPPFQVPQVISLAFWGGLWGIVFVLVERWLARSPGGYWVGATLFGAIFPTLVYWFVVAPLKDLPVGFRFPGVLVGPIIDGLWGLGTGLFLAIQTSRRRHAA